MAETWNITDEHGNIISGAETLKTTTQTKGNTMSNQLDQITQIIALLQSSNDEAQPAFTEANGKPVIVRASDAGVHFGYLQGYSGREVRLTDSRRLWRWVTKTGVSLSGVATDGLDNSDSRVKIEPMVENITILDACEIIAVSKKAEKSINGAKDSEAS